MVPGRTGRSCCWNALPIRGLAHPPRLGADNGRSVGAQRRRAAARSGALNRCRVAPGGRVVPTSTAGLPTTYRLYRG